MSQHEVSFVKNHAEHGEFKINTCSESKWDLIFNCKLCFSFAQVESKQNPIRVRWDQIKVALASKFHWLIWQFTILQGDSGEEAQNFFPYYFFINFFPSWRKTFFRWSAADRRWWEAWNRYENFFVHSLLIPFMSWLIELRFFPHIVTSTVTYQLFLRINAVGIVSWGVGCGRGMSSN